MKVLSKLMGIAVLAIFVSCTWTADYNRTQTVVSIDTNSINCTYCTRQPNGADDHCFYEKCGMFNVGDTIKVVKQ